MGLLHEGEHWPSTALDEYIAGMATLRLFASIREAAGTGKATFDEQSVGAVIDAACGVYGATFAEHVPTCRIWVNGEPADRDLAVGTADEVALLPPVSGG